MKKPKENIEEREKLDKWIQRFHWLRDDHYDDLQDYDVREIPITDNRHNMFMCQGNYIAGLGFDLQGLIWDRIVIDPKVKEKIKKFLEHRFVYLDGKFTTKEEIEMIKKILDVVIDHLESL
ncbi:hypothetical protein KJ632_04705 [Patescibacteria group bacterium]|nr:hypothetical protein [Patescibacteria group bacterium]